MSDYYFAGISYQENSARIIPDRASFASLPGEIRNLVYSSFLHYPKSISITYNATTKRFQTSGNKHANDGRIPFQVLELLSNLDHNIRAEGHSYFFANNIFVLETSQSLRTKPDYIAIYMHFLSTIGNVACHSLRWLRLTVRGDPHEHTPTMDQALKLWKRISECNNLETLDIYADIDYFYMDQQATLTSYMCTEGYPVSYPWSEVRESIAALPNLKRLVLRPVFSSRWRYCDGADDGTVVMADESRKVSGEVYRPVDEATRLTEQVKGYMRRGLSGLVSVRMVAMEMWGRSGGGVVDS